MKTKILAGLLLAGSAAFAASRVSFGIGFGAPAPVVVAPAPVVVAEPPCPGPGYVFVGGYWQLRPSWHAGFRPEPVAHFDGRRDHFRR
jgi:WXXGXW repeat (2 copies)